MDKSTVNGDTEKSSSSSGRSNVAVDDEDAIKCDILCRLPVKSLMRFKCVSKTWLSLIEQDSYFADLHYAHAKARPSLLLVKPLSPKDPYNNDLILTPNLSTDRSKAEIHTIIRKTDSFSGNEILGPVNGLICFIDRSKPDVRVYNISTREVTPRVRSTLRNKHVLSLLTVIEFGYGFGFDPVTKKHKAILCVLFINLQPSKDHLGDCYRVCEVLTIGDDAWRRIDEVPPCNLATCSVYVSGTIYYRTSKFMSGNNDVVLVAFDVGIEKFRTITIPNLILNNRFSSCIRCGNLFEMDGHVVIAYRMTAYIVKLWVYREDTEHDNKGKNTQITNFGNLEENWTEYTITLPLSWDYIRSWGFYTGAGMHQILIQSNKQLESGIYSSTLYSYDLKKETFTKIEVSGISPPIEADCRIKLASTFVESLFSILKQRSCSDAPQTNIHQESDSLPIV
ncbi:hypothetical protein MKW92_047974 [Papaver armeniacum]|nr:hypothetical protein MKW92_047974 [Papaver armeniacum]